MELPSTPSVRQTTGGVCLERAVELILGRARISMSARHPSGDELMHTAGGPGEIAQSVPFLSLKCF